jgi:lysophospholipase
MKFEEGYLECCEGLRLHLGIMRARAPRGWVTLLHGYGEHLERYAHVGQAVNQAGFSVFAFSFRGYGRSEGTRGAIERFDDYLDDFRAALRYFESMEGVQRVHVLAHSQGALIALHALRVMGLEPLSLVLSAPFLGLKFEIPLVKRLAASVATVLMPTLALPTGISGAQLTQDAELQAAYEADPLIVRTATARWVSEVNRIQTELRDVPFEVSCPTLVLQGTGDPIVDVGANERFYERLQAPRKDWKAYPGLRHEVFNEADRARVLEDLVAWYETIE